MDEISKNLPTITAFLVMVVAFLKDFYDRQQAKRQADLNQNNQTFTQMKTLNDCLAAENERLRKEIVELSKQNKPADDLCERIDEQELLIQSLQRDLAEAKQEAEDFKKIANMRFAQGGDA